MTESLKLLCEVIRLGWELNELISYNLSELFTAKSFLLQFLKNVHNFYVKKFFLYKNLI